jgi:hypothetical protein
MLGTGSNGESFSFQVEAKTYAATYHKQLLRPLMEQVDEDYPDKMIFNRFKDLTTPQKNEPGDITWSSRAFAKHVNGHAVVVLKGPATAGTIWPRNDDCWATDEYPVLTALWGACTEIVRIDTNDSHRPVSVGVNSPKGIVNPEERRRNAKPSDRPGSGGQRCRGRKRRRLERVTGVITILF